MENTNTASGTAESLRSKPIIDKCDVDKNGIHHPKEQVSFDDFEVKMNETYQKSGKPKLATRLLMNKKGLIFIGVSIVVFTLIGIVSTISFIIHLF